MIVTAFLKQTSFSREFSPVATPMPIPPKNVSRGLIEGSAGFCEGSMEAFPVCQPMAPTLSGADSPPKFGMTLRSRRPATQKENPDVQRTGGEQATNSQLLLFCLVFPFFQFFSMSGCPGFSNAVTLCSLPPLPLYELGLSRSCVATGEGFATTARSDALPTDCCALRPSTFH